MGVKFSGVSIKKAREATGILDARVEVLLTID